MKKTLLLNLLGALVLANPAFAGDPVAGESLFNNCKACHSLTAPDGGVIVKGGKNGPDLFGIIGRPVGSDAGYSYSAGILAIASQGVVWDESSVAAYTADPTAWVVAQTGDDMLRSNMTFKMSTGGEDVAAYLASLR